MARPLNILRAITWLPPGGIEHKILAVAPRLDRERFRVRVLCLRERGALAEELESAGVPVDVIPMRSRLDPAGLRRIAYYLRERRIDIVHAHMYRASVPLTVAARLAGGNIAVLGQVHNVDTWETRRQAWMDRFLCRWRRGMIAVSEQVRRDVIETLRAPPDFVRVIYNGVDINRFRPPADRDEAKRREGHGSEEIVVLAAMRLTPQKNPLALVEAARRILPDHPRAKFVLAGAGKMESEIRAASQDLGDRFCLAGLCDPMTPVYQGADVFALPSLKEGFSNALVEALACGLPCVATDVGGAREALEDSRAGLLIPPDDVESLTKALIRLIADRELRLSMSDAAAGRAQRFSLERMIEDVETLYLQCRESKNPGSG